MSANGFPRILLVIGGGIAAYKSCELVRIIRRAGGSVTCVLTEGGQQFVTPMALAALSENPVHTTLWDLKNEVEMGHIQLSREADLVVVCPATANMLAKMTAGIADDLATTLILATDKPVLTVPAMNVRMWENAATQGNVESLRAAGVDVLDPDEGAMACGEFGAGRLPEPEAIWAAIAARCGMDSDAPQPVGGSVAKATARDEEIYEAIEAEEEVERPSGLGSLLSALIPRSSPKHDPLEGMDELVEEVIFDEPGEGEGPVDPDVEPDLSSPILAGKGAANAAPPTDPEAINHTVITGAGNAEPEPLDPLDGQPEFDEDPEHRPLYGKHVLVTAGPTREAIDPVRYIANRSSGRQGFAIAGAAAAAGARVTLVAGPVHLKTPRGVDRIDVESAREMAEAVKEALPADAAIMVAAVADWRTKEYASEKVKKRGSAPPALLLKENPDILSSVASGANRPPLLVGFAAETQDVIENAKTKRKRKGADWIVANDVSGPVGDSVMGGETNTVHIVTADGVESLEEMPKRDVALALIERVGERLNQGEEDE